MPSSRTSRRRSLHRPSPRGNEPTRPDPLHTDPLTATAALLVAAAPFVLVCLFLSVVLHVLAAHG